MALACTTQLMVDSYIAALVWASCDEDGEPLDDYDLSGTVRQHAIKVCEQFLSANQDALSIVMDLHPDYGYSDAGHDLFLTREGHGTGFWDRNLGFYGDVFTKYAQSLGSCCPYVGDDNLVYCLSE